MYINQLFVWIILFQSNEYNKKIYHIPTMTLSILLITYRKLSKKSILTHCNYID